MSQYPALTGQPSFTRHPKQVWDSETNDFIFTVPQKIIPTTADKKKRELTDASTSDAFDEDDADLSDECLENIAKKKKRSMVLLATAQFSETSNNVIEELTKCLVLFSKRIETVLYEIDGVRCNDKGRPCSLTFRNAEYVERQAMEAAVTLTSTSNCVLQLVFRMSMAKKQHEDTIMMDY
jgi:hypothetical protein